MLYSNSFKAYVLKWYEYRDLIQLHEEEAKARKSDQDMRKH